MRITIARRDRPFSHEPGASCLLPRTCWVVQAFPTKIVIRDRTQEGSTASIDIPLAVHGPVREFTLEQDLERGVVRVWGVALEGRFCLCLMALEQSIECQVERAPKDGICCAGRMLHMKERLIWDRSGPFVGNVSSERLSLGGHQAQNWPILWSQMDLEEILPVLFWLSNWTPDLCENKPSQMLQLLDQEFVSFLRAAFYGILSPRTRDDQHQGLLPDAAVEAQESPCVLICEAGKRIRRSFVDQQGRTVSLLTDSRFQAGRMKDVQLAEIGTLDFEWSKYSMRRAVLHATHDVEVCLHLPQPSDSFRLRRGLREKGVRHMVGEPFDVRAGNKFFLDRFQKGGSCKTRFASQI